MADIELVIKIDEDTYEACWQGSALCSRDDANLVKAIKNSTPLPKGHDRLIYAKDVGEYLTLADVPTIVEADNEEKESEDKV